MRSTYLLPGHGHATVASVASTHHTAVEVAEVGSRCFTVALRFLNITEVPGNTNKQSGVHHTYRPEVSIVQYVCSVYNKSNFVVPL